jgi:hypothetical protein
MFAYGKSGATARTERDGGRGSPLGRATVRAGALALGVPLAVTLIFQIVGAEDWRLFGANAATSVALAALFVIVARSHSSDGD